MKFKKPFICACGKSHTQLPEAHKVNSSGFWWDCSNCRSSHLSFHKNMAPRPFLIRLRALFSRPVTEADFNDL